MSPLGGADHGRAERWSELELPLVDFMLRARQVLRRSDTSTRDPIISSVLYRISESCSIPGENMPRLDPCAIYMHT